MSTPSTGSEAAKTKPDHEFAKDMPLAPCPSCNSSMVYLDCAKHPQNSWVDCDSCGLSGPSVKGEIEAVHRWNELPRKPSPRESAPALPPLHERPNQRSIATASGGWFDGYERVEMDNHVDSLEANYTAALAEVERLTRENERLAGLVRGYTTGTFISSAVNKC